MAPARERTESMLGLIGCERPRTMAGLALVIAWPELVHGVKKGVPPLPLSKRFSLE